MHNEIECNEQGEDERVEYSNRRTNNKTVGRSSYCRLLAGEFAGFQSNKVGLKAAYSLQELQRQYSCRQAFVKPDNKQWNRRVNAEC